MAVDDPNQGQQSVDENGKVLTNNIPLPPKPAPQPVATPTPTTQPAMPAPATPQPAVTGVPASVTDANAKPVAPAKQQTVNQNVSKLTTAPTPEQLDLGEQRDIPVPASVLSGRMPPTQADMQDTDRQHAYRREANANMLSGFYSGASHGTVGRPAQQMATPDGRLVTANSGSNDTEQAYHKNPNPKVRPAIAQTPPQVNAPMAAQAPAPEQSLTPVHDSTGKNIIGHIDSQGRNVPEPASTPQPAAATAEPVSGMQPKSQTVNSKGQTTTTYEAPLSLS